MSPSMTHHEGQDAGDITLYALSTCVWCKKTKALLQQLGVAYNHVDVDLLQGEERAQVIHEVSHWNPSRSFPVLVVNNKEAIIGFDEARISQLLDDKGA